MHSSRIARTLAVGAAVALGLTACGSSSSSTSSSSSSNLEIATSFYPIQWLTEQIGGDKVSVTSVTPSNVEPHDYELAPKDVASLDEKAALFYVKGFQPSLDDAVSSLTKAKAVDLTSAVNLVHHEGLAEEHDEADHSEEHDEADHADEASSTDPHFWLDPQRMSAAADSIASYLEKNDAANAETYAANLTALKAKLTTLDSSYSKGLATCERRSLVTTHTAWAYLADRYKLTQVALSGVDPESEPSPATLAEVKAFIQKDGTTTIFTEELLSPKTAEALAKETGITTAVLNPLESKPESGDYDSEMQSNLTALSKALACK